MSRLKKHAEQLWEYEPTAVLRDTDGANGALCGVSGGALREQTAAAARAGESPVVLYDIFRSLDGKHVTAIQALADTNNNTRGLRFSCDGKQLESRLLARHPAVINSRVLDTAAIHQARVNAPADEPLRVEVGLDGATTTTITVPPNPFAAWNNVALTQVLVQKDNPPVWVRDHALFYHRAHKYERLVLYDNGSRNTPELLNCLASLDDGLQVLLIRWPFPMHRPHIMARYPSLHDVCSQVAAHNHLWFLLGERSKFVSHFDVDEYLCNRTRKDLAAYLSRKVRLSPCRRLWTERYANVTDRPRREGATLRAADFRHQDRNSEERTKDGLYKYFYRPAGAPGIRPRFLHVHSMQFKGKIVELLRLKKVIVFAYVLLCRLSPVFQKLKRPSDEVNLAWAASKRDLVLFHYDGIWTDWSRDIPIVAGKHRYRRTTKDIRCYRVNDEMLAVLKRVGLAGDEDQ